MSLYDHEFYAERNIRTQHAAETVLSKVMEIVPNISSAIDIGCGVGTWLKVFQHHGVEEIQGVDGPWVDKKYLVIPDERFQSYEFQSEKINLNFSRKYDIAICLEVAEHIDSPNAPEFVRFLCGLSDVILFSAAIPGQGGIGHVNEQWPSYWVRLFSEQGLIVRDILRHAIWNEKEIPWWYRQNMMLFVSPKRLAEFTDNPSIDLAAMSLVHPELLRQKTDVYASQAFRMFVGCVLSGLKRRFS